ncbi:MAG: hypothetical protein JRH15_11630 [Deltaproteobacteria bacterium]|nr:hypothetical protein [Deltaproteobacteria bacterium]
MKHIINTKQLRASLPKIIEGVRRGDKYTVLYRSRPAFHIVGIGLDEDIPCDLSVDPIYGAKSVGQSSDGLTAIDHDRTLYGKSS